MRTFTRLRKLANFLLLKWFYCISNFHCTCSLRKLWRDAQPIGSTHAVVGIVKQSKLDHIVFVEIASIADRIDTFYTGLREGDKRYPRFDDRDCLLALQYVFHFLTNNIADGQAFTLSTKKNVRNLLLSKVDGGADAFNAALDEEMSKFAPADNDTQLEIDEIADMKGW